MILVSARFFHRVHYFEWQPGLRDEPETDMSTEIFTKYESLSLSNMVFRRVIEFATDYAREQVPSEAEPSWIEKFAQLEAKCGQDVSAEETFASAHEVNFWANVLFDCAQAIYDRRIGSQDNQEWQVATIWAIYSLGRMLAGEYSWRTTVMNEEEAN